MAQVIKMGEVNILEREEESVQWVIGGQNQRGKTYKNKG